MGKKKSHVDLEEEVLKEIGISEEDDDGSWLDEEPGELREKLQNKLNAVLYDDDDLGLSSEAAKLEEELNEVKEGDDKEMKENVTKIVLDDSNFRAWQLAIPAKQIVEYVENKLSGKVLVQEIDYKAFYNLYLEPNKDLTSDDKQKLASEYYPSVVQYSNSAVCDKLLIAQINADVVEKEADGVAFLWKSNASLLKGVYESDSTRNLFGSRMFIPMLEEQNMQRAENKYYVYLSTLNTILNYLSINVSYLKEKNIKVSIGTNNISDGSTFNGPNFAYVIEFIKA